MWRLRSTLSRAIPLVALGLIEARADPPSIASVSPSTGICEGGTLLTIRGRGLDRATAVTVGGARADNFEARTPELALANAPPGRPGPAEIAVESPEGSAVFARKFLYQEGRRLPGTALRFDGADDFVTFGETRERIAHTVEAWVLARDLGGPCCRTIAGQLSGPSATASAGWSLAAGDSLSYALYRRASAQPVVLSAPGVPCDTWVHLAGTFDGGTARLYANGVLVEERRSVSVDPSAYMTAGAEVLRAYTRGYFSGELDEVRVWSYARSAQEIRDAMHHPLAGDEPGLVAYWPLDEGDGQRAGDVSGKGLDGVLGRTPAQESRDPAWVPSGAPIFERPPEPLRDAFRFGFEGPSAAGGRAGAIVREGYYATLEHSGLGPGAQGWSLSVIAEGAAIVDIITGAEPLEGDRRASDGTLIETTASLRFRDGFQVSEVAAGGTGACAGKSGAVSAVALSFTEPVTLPANARATIAWLEVEVSVPDGLGSFSLRYADGCKGSGLPVGNFATQAGESILPALGAIEVPVIQGPRFIRGDANADSVVYADRPRVEINVSDPIFIVEYLFLGGKRPPCEKAADANDDGGVDVSDAIYILSFLFLGGPEVKEPFSRCGVDPTPDDLDCEWYPPNVCS